MAASLHRVSSKAVDTRVNFGLRKFLSSRKQLNKKCEPGVGNFPSSCTVYAFHYTVDFHRNYMEAPALDSDAFRRRETIAAPLPLPASAKRRRESLPTSN